MRYKTHGDSLEITWHAFSKVILVGILQKPTISAIGAIPHGLGCPEHAWIDSDDDVETFFEQISLTHKRKYNYEW
jgi:hypothetical protein